MIEEQGVKSGPSPAPRHFPTEAASRDQMWGLGVVPLLERESGRPLDQGPGSPRSPRLASSVLLGLVPHEPPPPPQA